jgi:hypothetical protein
MLLQVAPQDIGQLPYIQRRRLIPIVSSQLTCRLLM